MGRGCGVAALIVPRRTPTYESDLRTFAEIAWSALISALKGLRVTSYNQFFRKRVTVPYPFKKLDVSPRVRGRHRVLLNEDGTPVCIACQACQRVCPDACISVTRMKVVVQTPEGEKTATGECSATDAESTHQLLEWFAAV